jgi:hypothetical protein
LRNSIVSMIDLSKQETSAQPFVLYRKYGSRLSALQTMTAAAAGNQTLKKERNQDAMSAFLSALRLVRPSAAPRRGKILAISTRADIGLARLGFNHFIGQSFLLGILDSSLFILKPQSDLRLRIRARCPAHQRVNFPRRGLRIFKNPVMRAGKPRGHRCFGRFENTCRHSCSPKNPCLMRDFQWVNKQKMGPNSLRAARVLKNAKIT